MCTKAQRINATLMFAIAATAWAGERRAGAEPSSLDELARRYQIEVVAKKAKFPVRTAHGAITGSPPAENSLKKYRPLFITEFGRYPKKLVAVTRLKRVVLCENLRFAGQRRNAIPDFEHDTLYLDVKRGGNNPKYLRAVIHHEYFHIIDFRDDGKVYRDPQWAALNSPKFKYGSGGKNAQQLSNTSVLTERFAGFLNHYSTTGVEEDKAEIFAHLLVNPDYVARRSASDGVLKSKVTRMKSMMRRFCDDVDETFWRRRR